MRLDPHHPVDGIADPGTTSPTAVPAGATDPRRRILIVSAPFGPLARVLATELRARGADVNRVILNAGDRLYWRGPGAHPFRGRIEDWPEFLRSLAASATDILVFSESGPYNRGALDLQLCPDQRRWVMENGYFRPDWVTLEREGTNASTQLPRTRQAYDEGPWADLTLPAVEPRPLGRTTPHHVIQISLHHLIQLPGRWAYPHYSPAYLSPAWLQCLGHIRRYVVQTLRGEGDAVATRLRHKGRYFLACLQRDGDSQLLRYSRLADNTAFLAEVIESFSIHAPGDRRLVVKNHPLDPGLVNFRRVVRSLALERGVSDRVDFIDGGNLAQLCRASDGMVVNNSSAALSALGFGTPVKVLGRAFFDFEGLTDPQGLDAFWSAPATPDPDLFERFRRHVIARTQINGNYHAPWALSATAEQIADRILAPDH